MMTPPPQVATCCATSTARGSSNAGVLVVNVVLRLAEVRAASGASTRAAARPSAMDRLSDDTVITIFKYLKPRELESVASASRALSERDAVWHELARELVGTRGGGGRPSGRSSARLRLSTRTS